jgi:hypothetical protein
MKTIMVRYKVKADQVDINKNYVEKVYAELKQKNPPEFRYATFNLDDGVSFVHIATSNPDGPDALADIAAFKDFSSTVADRCEEPPAVTVLHEVGSYKFFGDN